MRRPLFIIGSGGLAREMAMLVEQVNSRDPRWIFGGFIGNPSAMIGKNLGLGPILGDDVWLLAQDFAADLVVAIGRPKVRAAVVARYLAQGDRFEFPNLIHPSASLDFNRVEFGRGNVVAAGCRFTCDIEVQDFNLFNLNATVSHDVCVGSYNVIHAGVNIASGVQLGDRVVIGSGCQLLEYISLGDDAVIEPGAVVRQDVTEW